jgi:hypothetical protein
MTFAEFRGISRNSVYFHIQNFVFYFVFSIHSTLVIPLRHALCNFLLLLMLSSRRVIKESRCRIIYFKTDFKPPILSPNIRQISEV